MTQSTHLESALAKVRARFPHLAREPDAVVAQNACLLIVPGLTGLELLALVNAAGPRKAGRRE